MQVAYLAALRQPPRGCLRGSSQWSDVMLQCLYSQRRSIKAFHQSQCERAVPKNRLICCNHCRLQPPRCWKY